MKTFFENIWNWIKENYITLILIIVIIVLSVLLCRSCTNNKNEKTIYEHNIEALNDSICEYKCKNGELASEKTILIGDMNDLEKTNKKLYNTLKNMKVKNADLAVSLEMAIQNKEHDTCWIMNDTITSKKFNFDDMPYRKLSGVIAYGEDFMRMKVDTDMVFANLDLAVEDNKVKVHSDNPYLTISDMTGITIPEYEPTWCLVIGPAISAGWSPLSLSNTYECKPFDVTVGVSLTFGWNIKGVGKRIRR